MAALNMLEATPSFFGVGVSLTKPSLGTVISIGKNYIHSTQPANPSSTFNCRPLPITIS
jgi:ABC-type dipeptide/oligopeptide/nickel transport system permease subunit